MRQQVGNDKRGATDENKVVGMAVGQSGTKGCGYRGIGEAVQTLFCSGAGDVFGRQGATDGGLREIVDRISGKQRESGTHIFVTDHTDDHTQLGRFVALS